MGFVNPIKALKQAHYDDVEGALITLSKNALNRTARLVLPAAAVTVISWLMCQFGLYTLARETSAYWLQVTSAYPSPSFSQAIFDLVGALVETWTKSENIYDQPQWALPHLLRGSMLIFLLLLITISATPRFRIGALVGAYIYFWMVGDALVGINVTAGMILSQLNSLSVRPFRSPFMRAVAVAGAILGLYLMSFPSEFQDWKKWTRQLLILGWAIFPEGADLSRFWSGIGAQVLCISVFFSPDLQALCSAPAAMWLGKISFSLYLLHGPLMRSLLAWLAFGPQRLTGPTYVDGFMTLPGRLHLIIVLPIFAAVVLGLSLLWTSRVEPYFGKITSALQECALGGRNGPRSPLPIDVKNKTELGSGDVTVPFKD